MPRRSRQGEGGQDVREETDTRFSTPGEFGITGSNSPATPLTTRTEARLRHPDPRPQRDSERGNELSLSRHKPNELIEVERDLWARWGPAHVAKPARRSGSTTAEACAVKPQTRATAPSRQVPRRGCPAGSPAFVRASRPANSPPRPPR